MLQQGIADLFSISVFYVINVGRAVPILRNFYHKYQDYYILEVAYGHIFFTLYIRCSGIVLLSFQRYLTIAHTLSWITKKTQSAPKFLIIFVYWLVPVLISLTLMNNGDLKYDSLETMGVIVEKKVLQTGPIFYMRGIYPMFNGFLSYINPYCILFLNKDFAKHVWKSVTCKGELEVSDAPVSVIPHNCILPMTQTRELSKVDF
ncbi:hypothetical protein B9Z55_016884 [Caenorhabditis nigoni]|nr:hypothetical protein B9Z55_016884 [Caenorhabditis nigoni]